MLINIIKLVYRQISRRFIYQRNVTGIFWGAEYVVDKNTLITITIQRNITRGGISYDLRGYTDSVAFDQSNEDWRVEYFCENEGVISSKMNNNWSTEYYSYLNAKLDYYEDSASDTFNVASYWKPGMGSLRCNLPEIINIYTPELPAVSILDVTKFFSGEFYGSTTTEIGNSNKESVDYIYTYQDAAYLWFPRGSQETVVPFIGYLNESGLPTIHYSYQGAITCDDDKPLIFSGNIDFVHGVCAALLSVAPGSRVGNIDRYIGFDKQIVVDGVAYAVLDKDSPTTIDHQPAEYIYPCADTGTSFLRNLFFWIDGSLDGYETKKSNWGRIMLHQAEGFQTEAEITVLISQLLSKFQCTL